VLKDLIAASMAAGRQLVFEAQDVKLHDLNTRQPRVTYRQGDEDRELQADFVAGCDGFHGIARKMMPTGLLKTFERNYQIGWLGILVTAPPSSEELIYARHERGFALVSTRSPTLQRMYIQCDPHDDLANWPDERIWQELSARLESRVPWELIKGDIVQKNIVAMRSFVAEPMQHGRLYLAGDAAHIVPPTGAKGLNLAVADVAVLAAGLAEHYDSGRTELLDRYSSICLPRIWRAQRFSAWMTTSLHILPGMDEYQRKMQLAELENVVSSAAASANLSENYVGVPLPAEAMRVPWKQLAASRGFAR
jgi:p-hydroxybenzoate 3-monooxygenase